ncbi:FecCD family ABC transporter permease [Clostridium polynesiense]|uniref:FecCD family ABC transporter permease n=1 Tax=Clostridium polynesiense TaxID=1325933 RepID=UPI000590DA79|nr:iron ABC transporter permease [Clostridium polynesiense]
MKIVLNKNENKNKIIAFLLLSLFLILLIYLSITLGFLKTTYKTVIEALTSFNGSQEHIIIMTSRIPRTITAFLVGGALGLAGLLIQAITRNPLASPSILGVNSGAVFTLVIAIIFLPEAPITIMIFIGFLGALGAAFFVYILSGGLNGDVRPMELTLAGTALSALLFSLTQGMLYKNEAALEEVMYWMIGSVEGKSLEVIVNYIPIIILIMILTVFLGKKLNVLSLGEDMAKALGINTLYLKVVIIIFVSVLSGVSVALAGPIAFIGLLTPHVVKKMVGTDYRWLIPFSILTGALVLISSDILSRFIIFPKEVPVGAITALLGGPFFIYIAKRGD